MYVWQQTEDDDSTTTDNTSGELTVNNRPRPSPAYTKYDLTSLHIDYEFDAATLVSESAYVEKRSRNYFDNSSRLLPGGPLPILAQADTSLSETWSQELRLVSTSGPDDRWKWVAGAFASRQDVTFSAAYLLGDPSLPTSVTAGILNLAGGLGDFWLALGQPNYVDFATDVRVEELAVFADVTRRLGERWELSAGGRVYRTTSGGTAQQSGLLLYAIGYNGSHFLDEELRDEGFNPRVSLLWHASDDILAYGTVARGFRVGGVQPLVATSLNPVPAPDTFKSDSIWNYELGIRTQWLDQTLQLDLAAFFEQVRPRLEVHPRARQDQTAAHAAAMSVSAGGALERARQHRDGRKLFLRRRASLSARSCQPHRGWNRARHHASRRIRGSRSRRS